MIRKVALLAVFAALTVAGCGAGAQPETAKPTQLTEGANFSQGGIDARNLFLLGPVPGQELARGATLPLYGNLINGNDAADALVGIAATGFAQAGAVKSGSLPLPGHTLVSLGRTSPSVILTGITKPLAGGESVRVTFTFRAAQAITVAIPVVAQQGDFTTYPAFTASPTATPSAGASTSPSAKPTGADTASPSPAGSVTATPVTERTKKPKKTEE
ncbi:MAG: hypothetical protein ABIS86_20870 [Streptosporangiaceae bacterium]